MYALLLLLTYVAPAPPVQSAYVAAKHGVVGFTKAVALETAESNITCNAVCPGWVKTELIQKQIELKAEKDHVDLDQAATNVSALRVAPTYCLPD